jgi:anthranilate phosphoribosyltransferase
MIKEAISKVVAGEDLSEAEMHAVMAEVMGGLATPAQIAAFLTALRLKGETIAEITGAAKVMREKAFKIDAGPGVVVDTCGTGGDASMTFNISTTAAFVAAATGLKVAKHGNRSVSSRCGSADVLSALGVNIEAEAGLVEECLHKIGIGFLFAPMLHNAMRHAAPVRREIGIRTIFNVLGPLTNPAGAKRQLIGVYAPELTDLLAKALSNLGSVHAFVVRGEDGLDEITLTTSTRITELKDGFVKTYHIEPDDMGFKPCSIDDLKGGDAKENAAITRDVLEGQAGPKRDVVLANAGAVITAGGLANDLREGVAIARGAIDSGAALEKLEALVEMTNAGK